jgi:hypothetical protein
MAEATAQDIEIFNVKDQRKRLYSILNHVLGTAQRKFDMEKAANSDRQKWARIIVSCVESYGGLLNAHSLEELDERVTKLEEAKT